MQTAIIIFIAFMSGIIVGITSIDLMDYYDGKFQKGNAEVVYWPMVM